MFPISRDPPEGGTVDNTSGDTSAVTLAFPISRDPPEGGTFATPTGLLPWFFFQFLGIPPKGELDSLIPEGAIMYKFSNF